MLIENITRVNNSVYQIKLRDSSQKITVGIDPKCAKGGRYTDMSMIVSSIFENISVKAFNDLVSHRAKSMSIDGKKYVIERDAGLSLISKLTNFILEGAFDDVIRLNVSPGVLPSPFRTHMGDFKTGACSTGFGEDPLFLSDPEAMIHFEKERLFSNIYEGGTYNDPFTTLAGHAIRKYHPDFAQQNDKEDFEPIIITKDRSQIYALAHSRDYRPDYFLSHSEVVSDYFQTLIMRWGEEKVNLSQFRYGINLQEMMINNQPLTVDIIYKMNIGTGTLTRYDLERCREDLTRLRNELGGRAGEMPLIEALSLSPQPFTITKSFYTCLRSEESPLPTVAEALAWFERHPFIAGEGPCTHLGKEDLSVLMKLILPDSAERLAKYTGRKIGNFIDSGPTIASEKVFKPWVDDQELSETCDKLLDNSSWEYFNEQLAYAVCKKHLVHTHPEHEFQVGTLIPAPVAEGLQEWYRVSSCINSGTGNFSYTLEPVAADSTLPVIKLFRSTASGAYAFDSHASIKSSLNPLNPPGYEGQSLVEPFEKDLFLDRTIPIWVGYQYCAFEKLQHIDPDSPESQIDELLKIGKLLDKSAETLAEDESNRRKIPDTKELLRRYDWIVLKVLEDCFKGTESGDHLTFKESLKFLDVINKYSHKIDESPISPEEQWDDAVFITQILAKYPSQHNEMLSNLLQQQTQVLSEPDDPRQLLIDRILESKSRYAEMMSRESSPDELVEFFSLWCNDLLSLARARNESPEQKIHQKIICVGHSLGGALAQRTMAKYTLLMNRMPLPGQGIELFDFCSPGISTDDNLDFITVGNKHADFFMSLKLPFVTIKRRQTVGDFIALGGMTHLGATFTDHETASTLKWLDFDGRIHYATEKAIHPGVTDTPFSHGIQVAVPSYDPAASKGISYVPFDTAVQADFDNRVKPITSDLWKLDGSFSALLNLNQSTPIIRAVLRSDFFGKHPSPAGSSHPLYGRWTERRTEEGVFVVSER